MPGTKPPLESVLLRAVEARAEGNGWKVVAERVRRSPETVRRWPQMYPERWSAAMRLAQRRAIDDAGAEGVGIMRTLLLSTNPKIQQTAAWHLIFQRLELAKLELRAAALAPPPPPADAQLIATFVGGHTREQLIQLATNLLDARVRERIALRGAAPVPRD